MISNNSYLLYISEVLQQVYDLYKCLSFGDLGVARLPVLQIRKLTLKLVNARSQSKGRKSMRNNREEENKNPTTRLPRNFSLIRNP